MLATRFLSHFRLSRTISRFFSNPASSGSSDSQPEQTTVKPDEKLELMEAQIFKYKDLYLRALAQQDNMRKRQQTQIQNQKNFGITSFAKQLLDVNDNLQRAINNTQKHHEKIQTALQELTNLLTGVTMTKDILIKVFQKFGITEMTPLNEKFDPNVHQALFTFEDPEKENGTVGEIVQSGYMIKERVLRSPKVGVIKNP